MTARTATCPVCGRTNCRRRFTRSGYEIFRCAACRHSFVHPVPSPEELRSIYDRSYFERGDKYRARAGSEDPNAANDRRKLELIAAEREIVGRTEHDDEEPRLLDVGCARGGFLGRARERGFAVEGVELSQTAADHARKELKLDVSVGTLFDAQFESQSFDVVTMWDVIEHLDDPAACIEEVRRILRPGGIVALSTGDASALAAKLMGRRWHLLTPPQHLWYFERRGLEQLLVDQGFRVVRTRSLPKHVRLGFVLFKSGETFFPPARYLASLARRIGVDGLNLRINLFDIMTVVAVRGDAVVTPTAVEEEAVTTVALAEVG